MALLASIINTKVRLPTQNFHRFIAGDRAVFLRNIVDPRLTAIDRPPRGIGRRIDMNRSTGRRFVKASTWPIQLSVSQNDSLEWSAQHLRFETSHGSRGQTEIGVTQIQWRILTVGY